MPIIDTVTHHLFGMHLLQTRESQEPFLTSPLSSNEALLQGTGHCAIRHDTRRRARRDTPSGSPETGLSLALPMSSSEAQLSSWGEFGEGWLRMLQSLCQATRRRV